MHDRERSDRSALVASVCTAVVFLIGLWAGGYNYERQQQQSTLNDRPYLHLLDGSPESYQAICDAPVSETQADLCQQWKAAESATNTAGWAQAQFWLGVVGLAGLVATVIYARHAFIQTKIQARAALKANARATKANVIAREMGHAQVRAYMATSGIEISWAKGEEAPRITELKFEWKNHGQSPALDVYLIACVEVVEVGHNGPVEAFTKAFAEMELGTSTAAPQRGLVTYYGDVSDTPISAGQTKRWLNEEMDFLVYCAARYRDVFGVEHRSESCSTLIHRSVNGRNRVNFKNYECHNSDT